MRTVWVLAGSACFYAASIIEIVQWATGYLVPVPSPLALLAGDPPLGQVPGPPPLPVGPGSGVTSLGSGAMFGIAGVLTTAYPLVKLVLDQIRANRELEIQAEKARQELQIQADAQARELQLKLQQVEANSQERSARSTLERQVMQDQMREIKTRMDAAFRFLAIYRDTLSANRDWMKMIAGKYKEPLPEGFGNRIFDAIPDQDWDRLMAVLNPTISGRPEEADVTEASAEDLAHQRDTARKVKTQINAVLSAAGVPPVPSNAEMPVYRPEQDHPRA